MKDLIANIIGLAMYGIFSIGGLLPFYAAFKDFQADELFWAAIDIVFIVPGIIRGLMYLFGGM